MDTAKKINAITEIHTYMRPIKQRTRAGAAGGVLLVSMLIILLSGGDFNQVGIQALLFLAMLMIFVMVFAGRVALSFARKKFGHLQMHEYVMMYSEPEDLREDPAKVSDLIERRRIDREKSRF
jgi:hypothetical protein